jgi:hypothetical protein
MFTERFTNILTMIHVFLKRIKTFSIKQISDKTIKSVKSCRQADMSNVNGAIMVFFSYPVTTVIIHMYLDVLKQLSPIVT